MTLIELLVGIAVLVTVLAAVLPAISPNNDARKIREAARQLTSLLQQAQAQAARDGRQVGVVFTDADPEGNLDGMALEAYFLAEPAPYSGLTEASRVIIGQPLPGTNGLLTYGEANSTTNPNGNGGREFQNAFSGQTMWGRRIYRVAFMQENPYRTVNASTGLPDPDVPDPPPPLSIQIGDEIEVSGNRFLIVDDSDEESLPNQVYVPNDAQRTPTRYLQFDLNELDQDGLPYVDCVLLNDNGQPIAAPETPPTFTVGGVSVDPATGSPMTRPIAASGPVWPLHRYVIRRQPVSTAEPGTTPSQASQQRQYNSRGSAAPLQFPRGVGMDFDPTEGTFEVAVLFGSSGRLESVYRDRRRFTGRFQDRTTGETLDSFSLLLGRAENGLTQVEADEDEFLGRYDFRDSTIDDDQLEQRRREVNLLNANSRWVTISRAGRIVTSENVVFDPRDERFTNSLSGSDVEQMQQQRDRQREEARSLADALVSEGGR